MILLKSIIVLAAPIVIIDDDSGNINNNQLESANEYLGKLSIQSPRIVASSASAVISNWPQISSSQANLEVIYFPQNKAYANYFDMASMLCKVNKQRVDRGLVPVVYHGQLLQLAQRHAQFQSRYRVVTHADNAGQIGDRLSALGFNWNVILENVGAGANEDTEIVNAWVSSPSHLANILNPDVRFIGAAVSNGFWVQDFASPSDKNYIVAIDQIDACPTRENLQIYN
ncbi:hypothetical protein J3B02_003138 [Coemansia erecta]|uniref:SCP domain-containing protein n=1 Tax=Coemansia asiatica TaxID=1052880 RepID=A0A9W7XHY4_9FUNG|nr:hypothetical protein LPJ64_003409 [Coemansia asiatica]KAJ2853449.1 hypothetical protein J3B02_003138 [Coemansia erecta]